MLQIAVTVLFPTFDTFSKTRLDPGRWENRSNMDMLEMTQNGLFPVSCITLVQLVINCQK